MVQFANRRNEVELQESRELQTSLAALAWVPRLPSMPWMTILLHALQALSPEGQRTVVSELATSDAIGKCCYDSNGNHVIQKCIEQIKPSEQISCITQVYIDAQSGLTLDGAARACVVMSSHVISRILHLEQLIYTNKSIGKQGWCILPAYSLKQIAYTRQVRCILSFDKAFLLHMIMSKVHVAKQGTMTIETMQHFVRSAFMT